MSVARALLREIHDARTQLRTVVQVRITGDALRGSPVALPITPERQRTLGRLRAYPGGGVDADLATAGRDLEIVAHPTDWNDLLKDISRDGIVFDATGAEFFYGIPVAR